MTQLGTIGNVNPIDYGGGFIFIDSNQDSGPWFEYFDGLDSLPDEIGDKDASEIPDHKVKVYHIELHANGVEFLEWNDWADWAEVAQIYGQDPATYTAEKLDTVLARAQAAQDLAALWGWYNQDQYPLEITIEELHERWGLDYERAPMQIKLDNLDDREGCVLVTCDDQAAAKDDQSIAGSRWECPGDMDIAYAMLLDYPDLLTDLESHGYSIDSSEYCSPDGADMLARHLHYMSSAHRTSEPEGAIAIGGWYAEADASLRSEMDAVGLPALISAWNEITGN